MNPEELKYYIALQPKFREAMGALQYDDKFMCEESIWTVIREHEEFVTAISADFWKRNFERDDPATIRLPLPIDPVNQERGLWGMVKGVKKMEDNGLSIALYVNGKYFSGFYPADALLRALAAQEGVTP